MSDTVLVALITAGASIIPSLLIALINNKHTMEMKKYETHTIAKQNAVFEFLTSVGKIFDSAYLQDIQDFQVSLNKLLVYYPDIDTGLIDNIYSCLNDTNLKNKRNAILPLIKQLSKSIQDK